MGLYAFTYQIDYTMNKTKLFSSCIPEASKISVFTDVLSTKEILFIFDVLDFLFSWIYQMVREKMKFRLAEFFNRRFIIKAKVGLSTVR